ncbi:AAA family ATPase [Archangium lansingense]|uniref:AAA family ATPase n=1 Tax=Archangium lansingense TaxID=2995310 RepID=A0ABT3ZXS2_9BACT|nr:AAA family ATPase [Archangium lansinium]MCY1074111.1 AAA family ATPase [Archangium lansinium]
MSNAHSGNIVAFFARSIAEASGIPRPVLIVTPDTDTGWNDFGHKFQARLYLLRTTPQGDEGFDYFPMRLMFQGQDNTISYLNQLFDQHGPLVACTQVKEPFCSILTQDSSYRDLVSELKLEEAVHGLSQIGDAVVLESRGIAHPRLELVQSESFHMGALRDSKSYSAWRHAKRHLRHDPPPPITDAATNFLVKTHIPGLANAYEVNFEFNKEELLRNRIAVLIGQNGVGKTQFLLSIIKRAIQSKKNDLIPGALTEAQIEPALSFNGLMVFSSVSSDRYPEAIAPWDGGLDYNYFSLLPQDPRLSYGIDTLTAALADIIRSKDSFGTPGSEDNTQTRSDVLEDALKYFTDWQSIHLPILKETPSGVIRTVELSNGRYASLHSINGEQRTLKTIRYLDWKRPPVIIKDGVFRHLSSGQVALMRFAVQAIGSIQQGSLILMDEPETHLHPNFISVLIEVLHTILEATRSCAIIATHSAYIVREVPRSRVLVFRVQDEAAEVSHPRLQTFGSSIDSISQFVFGDSEIEHLHETLLTKWLSNEASIEAVLEKYGAELNPESLSYIRKIISEQEP